MTRPLSMDIRTRLVSAVSGGMSRRSAAKRFGVAASTAIKWVDRWERTGDVEPRAQGGDHRSHHLEAHAEEILALIEAQRDITLLEIVEHLDREHGLKVGQTVISGPDAPPEIGNAMPLARVPGGMEIHNIEMNPGQGGKLVRSAGGVARIGAKEGEWTAIILPSGSSMSPGMRTPWVRSSPPHARSSPTPSIATGWARSSTTRATSRR
jgi:transposase